MKKSLSDESGLQRHLSYPGLQEEVKDIHKILPVKLICCAVCAAVALWWKLESAQLQRSSSHRSEQHPLINAAAGQALVGSLMTSVARFSAAPTTA